MVDTSQLKAGDALPAFTTAPVSRFTLALYCGASGDHNPMHVDSDYAKAGGSPDVFAHGMLSMGYLGRLLTNWVPQQQLREYGVRFVAIDTETELIAPGVLAPRLVCLQYQIEGQAPILVPHWEAVARRGRSLARVLLLKTPHH